jgi:hypothetical protein
MCHLNRGMLLAVVTFRISRSGRRQRGYEKYSPSLLDFRKINLEKKETFNTEN